MRLTSLVVLAVGAAAAPAADLSKIDRTIKKEPVYLSKSPKYGLLVFGPRAIHETELAVPHPRMLERAFVMVPLAEIAPDLVLADKTVTERLAGMDVSGIERLPSGRDWWQA